MQDLLASCGRAEVIGPLGGGNRNTVLEVRMGRRRLAARWSRREPASLDWEIELLDYLADHGLRVATAVPALDRRGHIGGVIVQTWLDGTPPADRDWPAVAAALRALTAGWPQRPGFASTSDLLTAVRGGRCRPLPDAARRRRRLPARLDRAGRP